MLTALKQMYGVAFVSSDLIYKLFNSEFSIQQILVYMMDGLTSPSVNKWANEVL